MTFKILLTSSQQFMFCLGVVFSISILFGVIELLGSVSLFFIKSGKIFSHSFFLKVFELKKKLFIWLLWALAAACGIFSLCSGLWDRF